jgi:Dyp-type peroxidase family
MVDAADAIDLDDLQSLIVFRRPAPYWGSFVLARFSDAAQGRAALRALLPHVVSAAEWRAGRRNLSVAVGLTYEGLAALGLSNESLDGFPAQLSEGMAARASRLGDVGDSAPDNWDPPFGTGSIHALISITADSEALWRESLAAAGTAIGETGLQMLGRQHVAALAGTRTTFGYRDGISFPNIAGLPDSPYTAPERPIATGEFLLGYPSESGSVLPMPQPDVLGRNGTFAGVRKIHTRVAAYRRFLKANSQGAADEELLAAKMVGRWRSGAPLSLAPTADDHSLVTDPGRLNDFTYADDPRGLVCPRGAHIRRMNPRDSSLATLADPRIHRIIRQGAVYGPPLPDDVVDDDGAERGLFFTFMSARADALEFLKREWIDDGNTFDLGSERDPIAGDNDDDGATFTIPARPVRRRLRGLERFTVTRGGEYVFVPSLAALRWLADPER